MTPGEGWGDMAVAKQAVPAATFHGVDQFQKTGFQEFLETIQFYAIVLWGVGLDLGQGTAAQARTAVITGSDGNYHNYFPVSIHGIVRGAKGTVKGKIGD